MKVVTGYGFKGEREICDPCFAADEMTTHRKFSEVSGKVATGEECGVIGCSNFRDVSPSDPRYRPHLYGLGEAVDDVRQAEGVADVSLATAKVVGKTLFNVGLIAGKLGWAAIKAAPNIAESQMEALEKTIQKRIDAPQDGDDVDELRIKLRRAQQLREELRKKRESRSS